MKKVASLIFGSISSLIFAPQAFAVKEINACPQEMPFRTLCEISGENLGNIVGPAISLIFILAILLALLYLVWGGVKWLMSGGDKTALEEARNHIVAAIIGLVVIFLSYFILNVVIGFFFPGFSLGKLPLPSIVR